ncbi:hypothetical protein CNR22_02850 [Sphingobacteriaceae bacterium]|nr:hypothetical protein CNR22_02850 [Sphingobacteriaceae bacterium]
MKYEVFRDFIKSGTNSSYLFLILSYLFFFSFVYAVLHGLHVVQFLPSSNTLVRGDSVFYESLKNQGYIYLENKNCNAGFFPLFSYLWALTNSGPLTISIINLFLYGVALLLLCNTFKPDPSLLVIFMALPFMFFLFTPLSEALFFLACSVLLYGLEKKQTWWLFTGVLIATLTRPSFAFFIPAAIAVVVIINTNKHLLEFSAWRSLVFSFLLPSVLGLLLVCTIQFIQTGHFFAFFDIQSTAWGREFGLPRFPLSREAPKLVVWLSWFNCLLGVLFLAMSVNLIRKRFSSKNFVAAISPAELFSLFFLLMSFMSIVFTNPEWYWYGDYNGTYLNGINRYIQPNPFMLLFILFLFKTQLKSFWLFVPVVIIVHLIWFGLDPQFYVFLYRYKALVVVCAIYFLYVVYYYWRWKIVFVSIIVLSTVLQCLMFNYHMGWILVD